MHEKDIIDKIDINELIETSIEEYNELLSYLFEISDFTGNFLGQLYSDKPELRNTIKNIINNATDEEKRDIIKRIVPYIHERNLKS
ncbi:MAG: hypothetical protein FK734_14945, partial [Asgard group archaeon]|nr:hypothetical protein [Asgard group archaeon]